MTTAIQTTGPKTEVLTASVDTLLSQAIDRGVTVDVMERLVALREKMLAEQAKAAFNAAMAAFQAECPVITKRKAVMTKEGKIAYRYAPIESIVEQVKELIEKHGFRYSTTMVLSEEKVKAICRVVHMLGHEESSEMEVPLGTATAIMSQTQRVAAAQTFAKRYAFLNAFGIMTGDEDNDAAKQEPDIVKTRLDGRNKLPPSATKVMEHLTEAKTLNDLIMLYERAMTGYVWIKEDREKIEECYKSCVAKFQGPSVP